jgi:hypothetical protein
VAESKYFLLQVFDMKFIMFAFGGSRKSKIDNVLDAVFEVVILAFIAADKLEILRFFQFHQVALRDPKAMDWGFGDCIYEIVLYLPLFLQKSFCCYCTGCQ